MEWAIHNVYKDELDDIKNLTSHVKTIFDAAKPWMNIELWKAEQQTKKTQHAPSSTFIDELKKRGATEDELKEFQEEQDRLSTRQSEIPPKDEALVESDEYDPPPVVIG